MQNEINELRNQVRTLKRMLYGVFGLVVVGGLLAGAEFQAVPLVIQAKNFEVVNDEGAVVTVINSNPKGGVIRIGDKDGMPIMRIGMNKVSADESVAGIFMSSKNGNPAAVMSNGPDGGGIGIANKDGKPVVEISVSADGNGVVKAKSAKGEITYTTP